MREDEAYIGQYSSPNIILGKKSSFDTPQQTYIS